MREKTRIINLSLQVLDALAYPTTLLYLRLLSNIFPPNSPFIFQTTIKSQGGKMSTRRSRVMSMKICEIQITISNIATSQGLPFELRRTGLSCPLILLTFQLPVCTNCRDRSFVFQGMYDL